MKAWVVEVSRWCIDPRAGRHLTVVIAEDVETGVGEGPSAPVNAYIVAHGRKLEAVGVDFGPGGLVVETLASGIVGGVGGEPAVSCALGKGKGGRGVG